MKFCRFFGVKVSPDDIYKQIEGELIQKVAAPLGMSGARLDRILFQKLHSNPEGIGGVTVLQQSIFRLKRNQIAMFFRIDII